MKEKHSIYVEYKKIQFRLHYSYSQDLLSLNDGVLAGISRNGNLSSDKF